MFGSFKPFSKIISFITRNATNLYDLIEPYKLFSCMTFNKECLKPYGLLQLLY